MGVYDTVRVPVEANKASVVRSTGDPEYWDFEFG